MTDAGWIVGALALCALLVLAALTLARLTRLAGERETATREATELRARLDAIAQASAQHERDMRDDLAAARREQAEAAVALRREVGERLSQLTQGSEQVTSEGRSNSWSPAGVTDTIFHFCPDCGSTVYYTGGGTPRLTAAIIASGCRESVIRNICTSIFCLSAA